VQGVGKATEQHGARAGAVRMVSAEQVDHLLADRTADRVEGLARRLHHSLRAPGAGGADSVGRASWEQDDITLP